MTDDSEHPPVRTDERWPGLDEYYPAWLRYRRWYLRIPGVQTALRRRGELTFSASFGVSDVDTGAPLTSQHLFRIASHSKTFTTVLLLQLVQQGALRLDDRLDAHLPELHDTDIAPRTIGEIASHSAGIIRDGLDGDYWQLFHPFPDRDQLISMARDASTAVLPANEHFKYSNIGFGLLGLVIEAAGGRPYTEQLHDRIADPLHLADTGGELDPVRATDYAAGHSALSSARSRRRIEHVDTRALAAATGCYSTAADLTAFYSALLPGSGELLTDESLRRLRHRSWNIKGDQRGYGIGLFLDRIAGTDLFGHTGGYPGHITCSYADPESGDVLSVLTNCIDGGAAALAEGYFQLRTLGAEATHSRSADAARFTGRFGSLWGLRDVIALDDRLFSISPVAVNPADDAVPLERVDEATLKITGGTGGNSYGELMRYTFAADGAVESVRGDSGITMRPFAVDEASDQ
jgi:CubicO group peptidase (beta-lactamase class C family)